MSSDEFLIEQGKYARTDDDKVIEITHVMDLKRVVGRYIDGGEPRIFEASQLLPTVRPHRIPGIASVSDEHWGEAKRHFEVIGPLLDKPDRTRKDVEEAAKQMGVDPSSLYRWMKKYRETMTLASLVRSAPKGGEDTSRLDPRVEGIVQSVVNGEGLTLQKRTPIKLHEEIERRCKALKLTSPHINTTRNRMKSIPRAIYIGSRNGKNAGAAFEPVPGTFDEAKWPLQIIQIDHTPLDVIVVDDDERKPIGRAFLTVAIDVYSRAVVGYFISLDHPGDYSVGLCLVDAILPKDAKLAKYRINTQCPVYGKPHTVHADNAGEFRGYMLKRACENRTIDMQWRPVKKPRYGGHIERLCGTLNHMLKDVKGATFSNPKQRGEYDSDGNAVFTYNELSEWLAVVIYSIYHVRVHSGIGTSPMYRYEEAIIGSNGKVGRGVPPRILDERRLRIEFLPYEERAVHPYGIEIDRVTYYSDTLRSWINAHDPNDPKRKRKFIVYRDPRDISVVFFYDPELKDYFDIPYANRAHPTISLWELKAAAKHLNEINAQTIDEGALFEAHERLLLIERDAHLKTRTQRRGAQARRARKDSQDVHPVPTIGARANTKMRGDAATSSSGSGLKTTLLSDDIPAAFEVDDGSL